MTAFPLPADYTQLQHLTERYARFSASALGLGHLYGAAALPLSFALARSGVSPTALMLWTAAVALGFLAVVRLSRTHYQTLGAVTEQPRSGPFTWGLLAGLGAGVAVGLLAEHLGWVGEAFPSLQGLPVSALLVLVVTVPGLFRFLDQSDTRTAGLGMLLLGATLIGGRTEFAEAWRGAVQLGVLGALSVFLVWLALRQHAEARQVTAELCEVRRRLGLPADHREARHD
ncbi:hypothetical protein [Deinococcus arcticus]|uniref:Uncharacterized protein n=1 Tax=Deinococcus arcticus TaxID=2136176 RepID=A0A2T3W9X1_9DEIO|nr:hypothetical protein [Deinococcus arcticus]PTA68711.1 hypothetical protein C8263_05535 [Deinococcus arcticus]